MRRPQLRVFTGGVEEFGVGRSRAEHGDADPGAAGFGPQRAAITGSFNAGVAQWLIGAGAAPRAYTVSQGARLGRRGVVQIAADDAGTVWVGGASTTCMRGSVML
jgi:hypothetical protein